MIYNTPGVYIEEVSTLPASVAQVPSAIPAFLGVTEKKALAADNTEISGFVKIESLMEYQAKFGGTVGPETDKPSYLATSVELFYVNGGGDCYVYSVGTSFDAVTTQVYLTGLELLKKESQPTLILFPDAVQLAGADGLPAVQQAALALCAEMGNRFCILDVPSTKDVMLKGAEEFRGTLGMNYLSYGAVYGPWLKVVAQAALGTVEIPASGAIAGVYAAVDADRGVWKAPANVSLSGVVGLTEVINDHDQDSLNVDSEAGKSLNAIRSFPGKGIMVWGARTLDGNSEEWRYVPVRRLFINVEESIRRATAYVVFEPNDAHTWLMVKAMIENFLNDLWKQGALQGAKPEQAYFVNVGLGTSMTPEDFLDGRLIINVGMAAVRPAEFVIIRFSHLLQQA